MGGSILDYFLTRLNVRAKIVLCGGTSDYNTSKPHGLSNYLQLNYQRASIMGFLV